MYDKSVRPKFNVVKGRDGSDSLIRKVCDIDKVIFDEKYRTNYEKEVLLFRKNKDTYTFLFDGDKLIGYCCLLPLDKKTYKEIKEGKPVDDTKFSKDQILTYKPGRAYNLYFSQVAILPEYKGTGARSFLMKEVHKFFLDSLKRGIYINNLLFDVVTSAGEKMSNDYNLKKVSDTSRGTTIYSGKAISIICSFILKSSIRKIKKSFENLFSNPFKKTPYDSNSSTNISSSFSSNSSPSNNSSLESPHHDSPKIFKTKSFNFDKTNNELSDISLDKTVDSISTNKKSKIHLDRNLFKYEINHGSESPKNRKSNTWAKVAPNLPRTHTL